MTKGLADVTLRYVRSDGGREGPAHVTVAPRKEKPEPRHTRVRTRPTRAHTHTQGLVCAHSWEDACEREGGAQGGPATGQGTPEASHLQGTQWGQTVPAWTSLSTPALPLRASAGARGRWDVSARPWRTVHPIPGVGTSTGGQLRARVSTSSSPSPLPSAGDAGWLHAAESGTARSLTSRRRLLSPEEGAG